MSRADKWAAAARWGVILLLAGFVLRESNLYADKESRSGDERQFYMPVQLGVPPTPTSAPASSGVAGPTDRPGPSNTGPTNPAALTPYHGVLSTSTDGQIIQNLAIQPGDGKPFGQINVFNNNVKINNCTIDGGRAGVAGGAAWLVKIMPGVTGTVIENCSMTGTGDGELCVTVCGSDTTISNCQFYNTAGSVFMLDGNNITVKNNWLYEIGWDTSGTVNNGQVGDFSWRSPSATCTCR